MNNLIISIILYLIYIYLRSLKSFHMLQQNKYNAKKTYLKWMIKNLDKCFSNLTLIFIILIFFINIDVLMYLCFDLICCILIISILITKEQNKLPLKYTSRLKRLIFTNMFVHILLIYIMSRYIDNNYLLLILGIIAYINSLFILLSVFINMPVEKLVSLYYKTKAMNKLKEMSNMKVVGITGSYGKTSSKNILNAILNIKYNSMPTPKNYNTPNGLLITINNYLDKFTDVFIAEMGACQEGDIKELCDLVHPKYGIVTKIGIAHLATFKTQENIQKTKFELIESLPEDGVGILNGDDSYQRSYKIKNNCKIKWIGIDNPDVDIRATDISLTSSGTKFNVIFKGDDKKYFFETKLLGKSNIYNILSSIALGLEFGMSIEQLKAGVIKVKPVEHRLELKKNGNITFIDDAYNSNPDGAKTALDVLKLMPGKHVVVTPGMIELGDEEDEKNMEFGRQIATVADEVVLVGKEKTKPIYDGLIEKKFDKEKIHVTNDVLKAFDIVNDIKDGETYVLLENDLPDIFNER